MAGTPNLSRLRWATISVPRLRLLRGLPGVSPSSSIHPIRSWREKKSASPNRRRVREDLSSDRLAALAVGFQKKTRVVDFGWGTLCLYPACVRLRGWSTVFAASRPGSYGLQGNAAKLETGATGRSDAARKMVGGLSRPTAQRTGRKNQHFKPEPEGCPGTV